MKRRQYLAALGAPLAGCLDGVGARDTPPPDVTGGGRLVTLEAVDDAPADVAIEAAVTEPSVTAEHPARVEVTTKNEGRRRDVSIADGGCCLFDRSGGASEPAGLWLHRLDAAEHVDRDGDRWTRDRPADDPRGYPAYGCLAKTYATGESLTNEYHVWDDYRVDGYYPPGTYRFAERVTVAEPGGDLADEEDVLATFTWGFSAAVERP